MAGRSLLVLICWMAIGLPGADFVLAQEQEENPETEESKKDAEQEEIKALESAHIETVTVTATRVETDLMKTPVAVTVIDQETMDREGVQNVRDLSNLVPNMDVATINGQSTPMISMRGVRSTNETELGDPSVGVHLDGIYSPRMQGILGLMFDNERVEVLRGPQGTLFGRNSTVGSINIVSAKPKLDALDSRLWFQFGNYNALELQGMVNVPVSDTFAIRFAGRYHERDSHIDGYWDPNQYDQRFLNGIVDDPEVIATGSFDECTSPECFTRTQNANWWVDETGDSIYALEPADDSDFYMNAQEWAYRISGLWQPKNEKLSLNLSFQHFRSDGAGGIDLVNCDKLRGRPLYDIDDEGNVLGVIGTNDCSNLFPKDDTYQAVVNVPGQFYLDIKYLRSQFTWDIKDNLRLVYLLGLEDQARESAQDMEQSLNAWDQAMFFLPGTGSTSWSNEIQLQSQGNRRFNWIAGANIFQEKTETIGYFDNPADPKSLWDQPDRSTDAGALFAQGTYSFTNKWHMTLGYRYSDETKEDKNGRTYTCTTGDGCAPEIPRQQINDVTAFERESLNKLPTDYFEDPSVYTSDNGTPGDTTDDFLNFQVNDNKGSWSHSDWRIGLDYDRNENTLLYSYLATGFKAGGIGDVFNNINPRTGEAITIRTAFEPEEVLTLELGLKQRLLNGKLELRGAYFYTDYDDMQYAAVGAIGFNERYQPLVDANGDPVLEEVCIVYPIIGEVCTLEQVFDWVPFPLVAYFTQNVPGARIQGVELEYDTRPWKGGRIKGYATWLDTEITEDWITKWNYDTVSYFGLNFADALDPTNEVLEVNLKGNELAVSPPFTLHMTVDHAFLLERQKASVVPWVTAHWEDDSYLTIWNVDKHTGGQQCPEQGPDETPDGCLNFVIRDEDIRYTDDRRDAWAMLHAGVRLYTGGWMAELYAYNLTNEVVQYWGGAAEQVSKGSFSTPRTYGFRIEYNF